VVTIRLFTTLLISIQPCIVHLKLDCDILQLSQRAQVAGFKNFFFGTAAPLEQVHTNSHVVKLVYLSPGLMEHQCILTFLAVYWLSNEK
jgi:hypothetical protein